MNNNLKESWKLDTNAKYTDVVKTIITLSTASLLLPVFMARNLLGITTTEPLTNVFGYSIYSAWGLLGISIASGIFFQYLSAKWVRIAWNKEAGIFWCKNTKESTVEAWMEFSFWLCNILFALGIIFTIVFFIHYSANSTQSAKNKSSNQAIHQEQLEIKPKETIK